jgi:hypothetical protein
MGVKVTLQEQTDKKIGQLYIIKLLINELNIDYRFKPGILPPNAPPII